MKSQHQSISLSFSDACAMGAMAGGLVALLLLGVLFFVAA
jgi:hypothetical protein